MSLRLSDWLSPSRRGPRRRFHQVVQALESRTLLAGDVTAIVDDGNLTLTGDSEDNLVDVLVVDGDIVVQGLDGTSVNGSSDPFVAFDGSTTVPGDFVARLAGGDDTLRLFGDFTISGTTRIRDFKGALRLGVTDVTFGGNLHIASGNSADELSIAGSTLAGDLWIKAGGDENLVSIFESSVEGKTSVSAGIAQGGCGWLAGWWSGGRHGHCAPLMNWWHRGWKSHHGNCWGGFHDFTWGHDSGSDSQVVIEDSTLGDLRVTTGSGDDNIVVSGVTLEGKLRGWTGHGDDFVMAQNTSVTGRTVLRLGAGDDQFVTQEVNTFDDDVYASGGCGDDAQQISAETTFNGDSELRHFESSSVDPETIETRGLATLAAAADLRMILNVLGGSSGEIDEMFVVV
jgi:hypothetical protein